MAWSSATPWCSRRRSGSPSSTLPTRVWCSVVSTCAPTLDPEPRYIGRIGLRDEQRDSLLIDWRAPAAAVFYQATAAEPQDVVRRRVLRCAGPTVVGVEDELLDAEAETDLPIVGEGALMAQLSRARDRSMHSIVATIQAEQDKAIRAPAKGVVAISGGPGTGKTVVALHRAAFLLYSDRRRYETGGVLVVGPSGVFMRYIERVLPSLGETAVALRSLGEVVGGVRATRHDAPAVAAVKGSVRMAELMRRTSRQQAPGSPKEFRVFWRDDVILLDRGQLGKLRRQLMGQGQRNRQLPRIASALLDVMWRQVRGERGRDRGREAFDDDMLSSDAFVEFALSWWPALGATEVLGWLRDPEFLARVGEGLVSPEEQRLLAESWQDDSLSVEDVPLVDELRYALGDVPDRRDEDHELDDFLGGDLGGGREELTTAWEREYGPGAPGLDATHPLDRGRRLRPRARGRGAGPHPHAVADGRTPWPHRDLDHRRRCRPVVVAGAAESAAARAAAIEGKDLHAFHLSTNYRNSAEIYDYAAAYASRVGLDADLPTAVRSTGVSPREVAGRRRRRGHGAGRADDDPRARSRARWPSSPRSTAGPRSRAGCRRGRSSPTLPPTWRRPRRAGDDRIVVLTGIETKGLEFDGIVVVDPDAIEAESPTGRATLYVVLTRATQLLTLIR